eukprot:TRINITY_DN798_c1_g2_i4.p1 TRINITY_DN798_c1_g2~~TRINITY_DN798_c1_g2_i4.p1  ORF type:complete len:419 (-),score=111.43 TRINITY_DN798_c1_g2_i4:190-1446(-)
MASAAERLEAAKEREDISPDESIAVYQALISDESADQKAKEQAIYSLSALWAKLGRVKELSGLLPAIRPFTSTIPKAKTAKIVRSVIDHIALVPDSFDTQIQLCKEVIEWTRKEKRTFLRQRIENRLASLYLQTGQYALSLSILETLVREVKRLDDKLLLLEIQLLESRVHHRLRDMSRARASLTAARTSANAVYCPPKLQQQIDMQAGILHAEEHDYKTGYSYFFEAFETAHSLDEPHNAIPALKYMLLCRIMTQKAQEVYAIINSKNAMKYAGRDVDALRAVAEAYNDRSVHKFEDALNAFKAELTDDPIIHSHLKELYETLLEQNLSRLIEPFSRVQIAHVASLIELDPTLVESKLSQMILDKKLNGILDQGAGDLIVYDDTEDDKTYTAALGTVNNMGSVVDALFKKIHVQLEA